MGLVAVSPVLAVVSALIRLTLGPPVLFRQRRPGLHGRLFTLYKFRTMRTANDAQGRPLPDHQRLTTLGTHLRGTSLDELPQLFNVLKGDMSLVGPRPLLVEYLPLYSPEQARRHEVRPGITGLAQVSGRNDLTWEERFALDSWYTDHHSLALDLRILARTFVYALRREGISQTGHVTMTPFRGSPPAGRAGVGSGSPGQATPARSAEAPA